jgi:saccharopine dehydrogenase-like NADP-dependent oxidoreductase
MEQFDPDPFMAALERHGLPARILKKAVLRGG